MLWWHFNLLRHFSLLRRFDLLRYLIFWETFRFFAEILFLSLGVSICLDVVSIEIEISRFCLDINVQTKKSRSRSRISSRSENFGVSRQFVSISIEKCMDFSIFSSRFLDKSRLRLDNLDKNLDREKIKVDLDVMDNLDGFQKLVSTIEKSWSRSRSRNLGRDRDFSI